MPERRGLYIAGTIASIVQTLALTAAVVFYGVLASNSDGLAGGIYLVAAITVGHVSVASTAATFAIVRRWKGGHLLAPVIPVVLLGIAIVGLVNERGNDTPMYAAMLAFELPILAVSIAAAIWSRPYSPNVRSSRMPPNVDPRNHG